MAAITDLTWQQLADALGTMGANPISISGTPNASVITLSISTLVTGTYKSDGTEQPIGETGVIRALTKLLDAARIAQEAVNTGKVAGEKLSAFPAPTFGTLANGYAPITRTLTARAVLSSATQIVGTNS